MQLPRFIRPLLPLFPLLLRWSSALMFLPLALSTLLAVLLQIFFGTVLMGLQLCEGAVVMLVALIMPCPGLVPLSILHGLEQFPIPVLGVNTHVLQCSEWAVSVSVVLKLKPAASESAAVLSQRLPSQRPLTRRLLLQSLLTQNPLSRRQKLPSQRLPSHVLLI